MGTTQITLYNFVPQSSPQHASAATSGGATVSAACKLKGLMKKEFHEVNVSRNLEYSPYVRPLLQN